MPTLLPEQLKAQVSRWRSRRGWENERVFAIRTDFEYAGAGEIDCDGLVVDVEPCRSDLEARDLLSRLNLEDGKGLLLLMRADESKIGEDVRVSFAGKTVHMLDAREVLKEIYTATAIDPRVANDDALLDAMVMAGSAGAGRKAPGGALDLDFAWSVVLRQPDLVHQRPDLEEILHWSLDESRWAAVRALDAALVPSFFSWVKERTGSVAPFLETLFTTDQSHLFLPLGLTVGDLFDQQLDTVDGTKDARVRIENYLNGQSIGHGEAAMWGRAARAVVSKRPVEDRDRLAGDVDTILEGIRAADLAAAFAFSKRGFRDRWIRFADDIDRLGKRKWETGSRAVYNSLCQLNEHGLAPLHPQRLKRAEMAARLAAYDSHFADKRESPKSLSSAARAFAQSDSFVDWARFTLSWGDTTPEIGEAYLRLTRRQAKVRINAETAFGEHLQSWHIGNEDGSPAFIPIERAVEKVVAPLAATQPVLLLVMDGMNYPAFHQLSRSLGRSGWIPQQRQGDTFPTNVMSVLPSVTEKARWALFAGKVQSGKRSTEAVAFREHPALSSLPGRGKPTLFTKGDLTAGDSAALSPKVRDALVGTESRVIAVVINAIDDQLKTGGQLSLDWAIHGIGILPSLLEAAAQGDRVLVLTSDHGHIPELENTKAIETAAEGEARYRFGTASDDGERLFSGQRIEAATGGRTVVLPITESLRYGPKAAGYHGGACDLEAIIPLAVFALPDQEIAGYQPVDLPQPDWWDWRRMLLGDDVVVPTPTAVVVSPKPKAKKKVVDVDQLPLFADPSATAAASQASSTWIDAFFSSDVFAEQDRLLGRSGPNKDHMRKVLAALDANGGTLLCSALAPLIGEPSFRIQGILSRVARFTNVDSYEILEMDRDSDTVRLHRKLLASQFQLTL